MNNKKVSYRALSLVILLSLVVICYLGNKVSNTQDELSDLSTKKPKVIYKDRVIKVKEPYPVYQEPETRIIYRDTGKTKFSDIKVNPKGLVLSGNGDSLIISRRFILQNPESNKLLSIELSRSRLILQQLSIDGVSFEDNYSIDINKYKYIYSNNHLSRKKSYHISLFPEVEYSYRPLNKLHDLDVSLNLKTGNLVTKIGANSFLYPGMGEAGIDAKLSISYQFK